MLLMSVGGEKYVKTDLCEINLSECQIWDFNPFHLDVDESDRVYYFDDEKHELDVFTTDGKVEKKIALDRSFGNSDFGPGIKKLQVRNGKAVIFARWDGKKTHYVDLATGEQRTVPAKIATHMQGIFYDGRIVNFETGETIQVNPFEQPKGLQIGGRIYEDHGEKWVEGVDAEILTFSVKGESKRTKPIYKDGFFYVCKETVDVEGNVYAIYKKKTVVSSDECSQNENGDTEMKEKVIETYMLQKFDKNLEVLFSWVGRFFYINVETMNVYVLQLDEKNAKLEKWTIRK